MGVGQDHSTPRLHDSNFSVLKNYRPFVGPWAPKILTHAPNERSFGQFKRQRLGVTMEAVKLSRYEIQGGALWPHG